MALTGGAAYAMSQKYTQDTVAGVGALKGAPCQILSKEAIEGGNRITYLWEDNNGQQYTTTMDIMNGTDGLDGKTPHIGNNGNWFIGEVDTGIKAEGKQGVSIVGIAKTSTAGRVDTYTITLSDGTTGTFTVTNGAGVSRLSELDNDEGFIKATVNNLVNYYLKSDTYSKEEINTLLQNIGAGLGVLVVPELPTENISPTTIYLIKVDDTSTYQQYMYISNAWANLGTTEIDLSNYYTKGETDNLLLAYVKSDDLETILENYVKKENLAKVATSNDYNDLDNLPDIPEDIIGEEELEQAIAQVYADAQAYTNQEIGKIVKFNIQVVDELPMEDIDTHTIYLVPNGQAGGQNVKTEYMYIDGAWEIIGNTEIDLSNYPTIEQMNQAISNAVPNFTNKAVLDKFDEDSNGNLLYGGNSISSMASDDIATTVNSAVNNAVNSLSMVSEAGVAKTRYYGGKFQYYDDLRHAWIDMELTGDNKLIVQAVPKPMEYVVSGLDLEQECIKLKWKAPRNTVIDDELVCFVSGFKIIRKAGSLPANINDGIEVAKIKSNQFADYEDKWYYDKSITFEVGTTYYYRFFPYSDSGFYNSSGNSYTSQEYRNYHLFGIHINGAEADPDEKVEHIEGCDNYGYACAHMDYDNDVMNYGEYSDTFYMPKPCMLNTDGTVAYYLDPNDYTKKEDGTDSDVANVNFEGNAMMEWGGGGHIWWKIVPDADDDTSCSFYVSNHKADDDFRDWNYERGQERFYMSIYEGSLYQNKLRSISGQALMKNYNATQEMNYAHANGNGYEIQVYSDWLLVNFLLIMMGKSTDTQTVFGQGYCNDTWNENKILRSGTMNARGLFWGERTGLNKGVKIFGMENWYGNIWMRMVGLMLDHNIFKAKLTRDTTDGSTVVGYNTTAEGYISIDTYSTTGTTGQYQKTLKFTPYGYSVRGNQSNSSLYYTDGFWFNNSQLNFALVCGSLNYGAPVGALSLALDYPPARANAGVGACLSFKPLAV